MWLNHFNAKNVIIKCAKNVKIAKKLMIYIVIIIIFWNTYAPKANIPEILVVIIVSETWRTCAVLAVEFVISIFARSALQSKIEKK